jgi:hypothetical protein
MQPAVTGQSSLLRLRPGEFNMKGFHTASRQTPVSQSYGSKLFHCCDLQGCQIDSVKLPRNQAVLFLYSTAKIS